MTKLKLNNLKYEGYGIPDSAEALQDQINDHVKSCKKENVKVSPPKGPTLFTDIVRILKEHNLIASNEPSDDEDDEVREQKKQHMEQVKYKHTHTQNPTPPLPPKKYTPPPSGCF